MNRKVLKAYLLSALMYISSVHAQDTTGLTFNAQEPEYLRDARMEWFRDAHFGMFVHWGLYSVAGGIWKGKDYAANGGAAEWLQNAANIPADEYARALTPLFTPKKDFARDWAAAMSSLPVVIMRDLPCMTARPPLLTVWMLRAGTWPGRSSMRCMSRDFG